MLRDDAKRVVELWTRWQLEADPRLQARLRGPSSCHDTDALGREIGVSLPAAFLQSLRIHDGQDREEPAFVDGGELLSCTRILAEWRIWHGVWAAGDFAGNGGTPSPGVKADWWNPSWIPITYDGAGNHVCIDLDPAPSGICGQVIEMFHDDGQRKKIADNFTHWLADQLGLPR